MRPKLGPGAIVVLAAAVLTVIASFLPWIDRGEDVASFTGVEQTPNAWGKGLFPLVTLVAFAAVLMLVDVAIAWFGSKPLAPRLGMGEVQLRLAIAIPALAVALAFWMLDLFGSDRSIGFWLSLLGAVGMVAGAVLSRADARAGAPLAAGYRPATQVFGSPGAAPVVPVAPAAPTTMAMAPGGQVPPAAAGPVVAPVQPYWFYVEQQTPIVRVPGSGEVMAVLQPGEWYLARQQEATWVLVSLDGGVDGWVELAAVHRQA